MRVLLVSIVPPQNDCGVRIVMHRHLVERSPFVLHVATNTRESWNPELNITLLELPYPLQRLRRSRFGPRLTKWFADYENFIFPLTSNSRLNRCIEEFKPDVILTLAETGLCHLAAKAARRHGIPLAGLFLDWFPIMTPHFGHAFTKRILSNRYRRLYRACDLAICTSDGMKSVLGEHPNSHVIYPMPGMHRIDNEITPPRSGKFRLVYVGAAQSFYGRMLRDLLNEIRGRHDIELIVVGPTGDWPDDELSKARQEGCCLGAMPPKEAAKVLSGADALLVVMSFEPEHELFMRTSFTTKFLDYAAFHKPIVLWAPVYSTPVQVAKREAAAVIVDDAAASRVVTIVAELAKSPPDLARFSEAARHINENLFNPDRLQDVFVKEISALVRSQDT